MKKFLFKIITISILLICFFTNIYSYNVLGKMDNNQSENKIIYLTFDDGPSNITEDVLDVLNKYDVKATFFLIGNQIEGNEDIVKRINNEGHGIGLHSYTHNIKKIYSRNKYFIEEMLLTQKKINEVIGVKPVILRFPGGSRNRLNKENLKLIHSNNFKIYDWNIDSKDGINPKMSPNQIFKQATKIKDVENPIILLMHCDYMHKNTCRALPEIIKFYKNKGYEFKIIDENTPEYYFK
ncbi:Peptidoglycan/xylan/chitin deacetylase, PgdA/CDA1 family [Clostridium sp. USBA 49]|uniref:polysaccharide deacetylase family protein n=1 Tax=Clostridium TaxID=1485 RepID=UPI0009996304|nr:MULTISPECIES: polysaccharide deacetylase family protein [Clostridium]SKA74957.1 Peptidoglycan/xylan/chitin deacetylase, PgdA/CDA1 family [Clostridium sp. USBA 49]